MDAAAIVSGRDAIVAEHGPWVAFNITLDDGVSTMGHAEIGTPELLVHSIVQVVADLSAKPLDQIRVLDLGCHEGGYAIELGLHGATVVGLEGRPASLAKAQFAAEVLALPNVTFHLADVRQLAELDLGRFDVVLCLGILYHLRPEEAVALVEACARICDELMVVRSAIAMSDNLRTVVGGHTYSGRTYQENPANLGASLDAHESVFPSRGTVIDLLREVGFTSSFGVRQPVVPELELLLDSVTIAAVRGRAVSYRSMPGLDPLLGRSDRPSGRMAWLRYAANPQQGLYWRVRERLFHTWTRTVFQSRKPVDRWPGGGRR